MLIVDDEDGPRASLRAIFKDDYELLMAADGPTAIELVQKNKVDVAELKVAFKPDASFLDKVKEAFGMSLMMKVVEDPMLIGGFLLRYHDGRTFDGTIKG